MTHVLFVCVKNGGKSQMAEGLLRHLLDHHRTTGITVSSAGTHAGTALNADSVRALAETGVDISAGQPTQLTPELQQHADWVITLGAEAHVDPIPGPTYETWDTDEPSRRGITGEDRMRLIRDDISRRVTELHTQLSGQAPS